MTPEEHADATASSIKAGKDATEKQRIKKETYTKDINEMTDPGKTDNMTFEPIQATPKSFTTAKNTQQAQSKDETAKGVQEDGTTKHSGQT